MSDIEKRTGRHYTSALEHARKSGFDDPEVVEREEWITAAKQENPDVEWTAEDITAAMARVAEKRDQDLFVAISAQRTRWVIKEEGSIEFDGGLERSLEWLKGEGQAWRDAPMISWVHFSMQGAAGHSLAFSELRRGREPVVRVIRSEVPSEGFANDGWVIERLGPLDPTENHLQERSKHPMFSERSEAMKYATVLAQNNDPADPDLKTKVVEKEVRVPDR